MIRILVIFNALLYFSATIAAQVSVKEDEFYYSVRIQQLLNRNRGTAYNYVVYMKSDTLLLADIKVNPSGEWLKLKRDERISETIIPRQTKSLYKLNASGIKLVAIPFRDSVWIYPLPDGPIRAYTIYPPKKKKIFALYFQNESTPVTKQIVLEMVKNDHQAEKLARKGNFYKAILGFNQRQEKNNPF